MTSVEVMMQEHQNILRMVKVVRALCFKLYEEKTFCQEDLEQIIDFIKNYADVHHHGKEEKYMFAVMQDKLGKIGSNLITHGMLVEHDLGRLHMQELNAAIKAYSDGNKEAVLDIIANAISYTHLIERHIKKEDELVYPFGEKQLTAEDIASINEKTEMFEKEARQQGTQDHYLAMLSRLEEKYL